MRHGLIEAMVGTSKIELQGVIMGMESLYREVMDLNMWILAPGPHFLAITVDLTAGCS